MVGRFHMHHWDTFMTILKHNVRERDVGAVTDENITKRAIVEYWVCPALKDSSLYSNERDEAGINEC